MSKFDNITVNVGAIIGLPLACYAAWKIGGWEYAMLAGGALLCLMRP